MARKILMVGLGGTGCKAVARVRSRVLNEQRNGDRQFFDDIAFVGIDTDLNQNGRETLPMVLTSRNASVEDILSSNNDWDEWFPAKNVFLRGRNMLKGAGQIRVLSRLALEDTLSRNLTSDDPMKALNDAFDQLQQLDGDSNPNDVTVMIISSFAGGTGSGIFIQTALYLRNLILNRLHCNTAIIRGLFALPDIYVGAQNGPSLIENVYANAYASLKELCAINRLFSGNSRLSAGIRMRFSDQFDSDTDRDANGQFPAVKSPYDFIFFVDDVNGRSGKLNSIEAYNEQIADIAYMQLYSPMAQNMSSEEDNQIRSRIISNGQRIFGSAGFSRIVYPHDEIVDYCAKSLMKDAISNTWLQFDQHYRNDYMDAVKRRRQDPAWPLPKKDQHFCNSVSNVLQHGSAIFPSLRDDIILHTEENDSESDQIERQDVLLENIKAYIKAEANGKSAGNDSIRKAATEAAIDQFGKRREDIIQKISNSEKQLQLYKRVVEEQTRSAARTLMCNILPDTMSSRAAREPYTLASLLYSSDTDAHAVHPLSARYLLYRLRDAMKQEVRALTGATVSMEKKISGHLNRDWDEKKEGMQRAAQSVPRLRKRPFVNLYTEARESCYSNITRYAVDLMTLEVFKACLTRINLLIKRYETMFQCLFDIMEDTGRDIFRLETMHDVNRQTTTYVSASSLQKRAACNAISIQHSDMDSTMYESILTVIYGAVIQEENELRDAFVLSGGKKDEEKAINNRLSETIGQGIRELFRTQVEDTFRRIVLEDQSDAVNISVIRAIEKQCAADMHAGMAATKEQAAANLLTSTKTRAMPFLMYDVNAQDQFSTTFWGVNDQAARDLHSDANAFFAPDTPVMSNRYSYYEICCYRAVYAISLDEIPKFQDTGSKPGIYYHYYESLRQKMFNLGKDTNSREDALTPHVDYHWIERSYLPMISDSRNDEDDSGAAIALFLGCVYGSVCVKTISGTKKTVIRLADPHNKNDTTPGLPLQLDGQDVRPHDYPAIYRAFRENSVLTNQLLSIVRKALARDCRIRWHTENKLVDSQKSPFTAALIDMSLSDSGNRKGTNPLTILGALLKDDLIAEEENMNPILQNALIDLINEKLTFSRENTQGLLKQLIYRYSSFGQAPGSMKTITENLPWLESWRPSDLPLPDESMEDETAGMDEEE